MPTIRIPPGVVRGESNGMVSGRWSETNLIRWQNGRMKPVGGWDRLNPTSFGSAFRAGHVWLDNLGQRHAGYLCDGKVIREHGSIYYDITPPDFVDANSTAARGFGSGDFGKNLFGNDSEDRGSGLGSADPSYPLKFSLDNWDDELLFCSSADGRIFVWDPSFPNNAPVVALNTPSFVQSFLVTDEHHLMIFGPSGFPNRVIWSGQDDREDFDFADVAGSAGYYDLEGAGQILTAVKIPGGVLIFTSTSVWIGRYIGQPYFYGFSKIATGARPISPHAISVAGARAVWMGTQSFWTYQGGVVIPLPTTLGADPFETIFKDASMRRVTAGFNGMYPEFWFFYPEYQELSPTETENNRYVIYNFEEGWWADGWMERSFYTSSPIDGYPIAGDPFGFLYRHEQGYLAEGAPRLDMVYAKVGNISFDDGAHNWQVNQAQIDSPEGPESVSFKFSGRRVRGGPEVFLQEKSPRSDGFLDLHFTARDFSMLIEGKKDAPWALGAMVFNKVVRRGPV